MNNILDLPYDIITYILEYLTVKDIVEFSVCNKKTYDISKSIENKYKITLNISKLDILDSIHKFPNIKKMEVDGFIIYRFYFLYRVQTPLLVKLI